MAKKPSRTRKVASSRESLPGIESLEFVDPQSLKDFTNPLNWRKHPQRQRQAYKALKSEVGYAGAILFNRRTNKILDGHMRLDEAIKSNDKTIPVLYGHWSEDQENLILEKLDPITALAETNAAALDSLIQLNQTSIDSIKAPETRKALTKLNHDLANYSKQVASKEAPSVLLERKSRTWKDRVAEEEADDDTYDPKVGVRKTELVSDVIFPSSNPWGIPDLLPDQLCTEFPEWTWSKAQPFSKSTSSSPENLGPLSTAYYCYGAGPNTYPDPEERSGGFLGFYTEDFRFERCWNDTPDFTQWLLDMDFSGVLLPDYSQYGDWPYAVNLHNLYRSRWCGRYWQDVGIKIIPIIQDVGNMELHHDIIFATLPTPCPVVAIQCRTGGESPDYYPQFKAICQLAIDHLKPSCIVIYGGNEHRKYLEGYLPKRKGLRYVLLDSFMARRRKAAK